MPLEAIIATLLIVGLIILFILIRRVKSGNVKNDYKELQVRYNAIKTIPLTFKLNKATYIAKINDELAASLDSYRTKIEKAQNDLDNLQETMNEVDDLIASKKYNGAKEAMLKLDIDMKSAEEEINEVESFLDSITQREQVQRERANELKDVYRDLKQSVQEKANELSFAYEGMEYRLKECEGLFSSFEEQIYGNEFVKASEDLEKINTTIDDIKKTMRETPELIQLAKGTIPVLMEEVDDYYIKTKAKGICTNNISVELKLKEIGDSVNKAMSAISKAKVEGLNETLSRNRQDLENILNALSKENLAFEDLKKAISKIDTSLKGIEKTYYYIQKVYETSKDKYNLDDLKTVIDSIPSKLEEYKKSFNEIGTSLNKGIVPCSTILTKANELQSEVETSLNELLDHKHSIDKTSNDENRANVQIVKLQIVLNEVEVKIAEYRLPAISESYREDLKKGHEYVNTVNALLKEIPLNIKELNSKLNEAIDFIYKLYNNVNNVVGMAVMVENAIVFGNKYRSTYPEVDVELSKAEFSYLNGEYTQSLTIAIACIERLFPKEGDEKIKEYAKGY